MNEKQLDALLEYIDARVDEMVRDALRKDSLMEAVRTSQTREVLYALMFGADQ